MNLIIIIMTRALTPWNIHVKKTFATMKRRNHKVKFSQALKYAAGHPGNGWKPKGKK